MSWIFLGLTSLEILMWPNLWLILLQWPQTFPAAWPTFPRCVPQPDSTVSWASNRLTLVPLGWGRLPWHSHRVAWGPLCGGMAHPCSYLPVDILCMGVGLAHTPESLLRFSEFGVGHRGSCQPVEVWRWQEVCWCPCWLLSSSRWERGLHILFNFYFYFGKRSEDLFNLLKLISGAYFP